MRADESGQRGLIRLSCTTGHLRTTEQPSRHRVAGLSLGAPCLGDPGGKQERLRCSFTVTGTAWPAMRLLVPAPEQAVPV
jgi:hypothetical protein